MRAHLEVEPPRAWYYRIFSNSYTLVILLQVDPTSSEEPETVYEGFYETGDISIFAWFSVPSVGHYHWLHDSIRRLPNMHHSAHLRFPIVMNYHYCIAQDLTCICSSLLSSFINVSVILKLLLSLTHYHTIYLIVKLSYVHMA